MQLKLKISNDLWYKTILVSIFLQSYVLFYMQGYPVTIFTVVMGIYLIYMILNNVRKRFFDKKPLIIIVCFIVYVIFNYIFLSATREVFWGRFTSVSLCIFFLLAYLNSKRSISEGQLESNILFFQKLIDIAAVLGILQIIVQFFGVEDIAPWIEGHMLQGFNWQASGTEVFLIGDIRLHRAHALFIEPSYFSQFLAINILIYIFNWNIKKMKNLVINALALLMSFSGTGIALILFGIVYLFIKNSNKSIRRNVLKAILWGAIGILVVYIIQPNAILVLIRRVNEFFSGGGNAALAATGWTTTSGYVRFIGVWVVFWYSLMRFPFMGSGMGSQSEFVASLNFPTRYTTDNGFVRVFVELGLIGIILYLFLLRDYFKRTNNELLQFLSVLFIMLNFLSEPFLSEFYWGLLISFNVTIRSTESELVNLK